MPEKHQRFSNCEAVTIDSVYARSVRIAADSDLKDELKGVVYLEAQFVDQAEMEAVLINEGRELVLKGRSNRSGTRGDNAFNVFGGSAKVSVGNMGRNDPTLEIVLTVPVGFPVRVIGCGVTEFTVDTRGGRMLAELEGSCGLKAVDVTSPKIEANGVSRVSIGKMRNGARFEANGSSRITIDHADGGDLEIELNGASNCLIETGVIGKLDAETNGASKLSAFVTADKAHLEAAGASSIIVSEVAGAVIEDRSGGDSIKVGQRTGNGQKTSGKSGGAWWK